MKSGKWLFILLALCLNFSVTPARAFAGQTISQTADQVQEKAVEKTVFEEKSHTLAQAQGEPEETAPAQAQKEKKEAGPDQAQEEKKEAALAQAQEEPEEAAPAQTQGEPEKDTRSILLHIPFVCAVMILLLAGFIIWGKRQESKEM